jgi:hypothetical protein
VDLHSEQDVHLDRHFVPVSTGCIMYIFIVSRVIASANQKPRVACIHCSSYTKLKKDLTLCSVTSGGVSKFGIREHIL